MRTGVIHRKILTGLLGCLAALAGTPGDAIALGTRFDIPYPSVVLRQECARNGTIADDPACIRAGYPPRAAPPYWTKFRFVWWEWDPPSSAISIDFTFHFNPSLFTPINDGTAGFLCNFTTTGNCPTETPGSGLQPIEPTATPPIPGPASGSQLITIGSDTVHIQATFAPSADLTSDELFFAMKFEPQFAIGNYSIEYSQGLLPDADYYVVSYSCTTTDDLNGCGSSDYTQSFRVVMTPEPGTIALVALSTLGVTMLRRGSRPRS